MTDNNSMFIESLNLGMGGYGISEAPEPKKIKDKAEYEALSPGLAYIAPDGSTRTKPYKAGTIDEYKAVPEGEHYAAPDGSVREKPKFGDLPFTSQTLYNMAVNDKERRKALSHAGGEVKEDTAGGLYVELPNGTKLKPRGFSESPGSTVAAAAAPVIGSTAGSIIGGLATLETGPGAAAGAFGGATVGGMGGQAFNDIIMQLAGTYDRSVTEEVGELGWGAAGGAIGEGVGRLVSGAVKSIPDAIKTAAPRAVANILGMGAEDTSTAARLAEKGVLVPPSAVMKEAPHVQNLSEVLDPAFRTQQPLRQSAEQHYENSAKGLLERLGVSFDDSIIKPKAAPSTKEAGEAVIARARDDSRIADEAFQAKLAERKAAFTAGLPARAEEQAATMQAWRQSHRAAHELIESGLGDVQSDIDTAMKIAKAGSNSGDLWWQAGEKLKAVRQGIQDRHKLWYSQADEAAGGLRPNVEGLSEAADDLIKTMPEGFENRNPSIARQIRDLVGVKNPETGEWIKEPVQPSFGQLHNLRSELRQNINWVDLASDRSNGALKFLQNRIDGALHDPRAPQELQLAARLLDATDKSYGDEMRVFNAANIKRIMRGLEAGEPADPNVLLDAIAKEGHTSLTNKMMDMLGPELANALRATDKQAMLDATKTLGFSGERDISKFADQVLDRYKSGLLQTLHGDQQSSKLFKLAQQIQALEGKIAIPVNPTDTTLDILAKGAEAGKSIKKFAEKDPLAALGGEMKKIEAEHTRELKAMQQKRATGQLGFLYNPTVGAAEAVKRILANEDLILAAAAKFGDKSPEFEMLRQIWAQRILTNTVNPTERIAGLSPEIQQVMFPGATLSQMQTLAKEMNFLLDTKAGRTGAGKSIMATEAVEHPAGRFIGRGGSFLPKLPGADFAMRAMLTKYYALVTTLASHPALFRWVEKGLKGDDAAREVIKREIQKRMQQGSAVGAAVGETLHAAPQEPPQ